MENTTYGFFYRTFASSLTGFAAFHRFGTLQYISAIETWLNTVLRSMSEIRGAQHKKYQVLPIGM